jgi:preprotein translocase subunit SecF
VSAIVRLYRGQNDINFPKWWRRALVLSAVLMVISIGSFFTRGLNLGIDFVGGVSWQVEAPGVSVTQARNAIGSEAGSGTKIQTIGNSILVEAPKAAADKVDSVRTSLAKLAHTSTANVNVSTVGPSWGQDISKKAEQALVVFLAALLIYLSFRLEWKMAVAAILAMVHDVVISVGVYSLFQLEVTPETVVAFLTILGYSIYDTIVVFDKVKENQSRPAVANRLTFTDLGSLSMNQVLMRSVNTSIVALLPVISMLVVGAGILGAVTLEQFSIALLVGMFSGAYSSIFIAAPITVAIKEREPRNQALRHRLSSGRLAPPTTAEIDAAELADDDEGPVGGRVAAAEQTRGVETVVSDDLGTGPASDTTKRKPTNGSSADASPRPNLPAGSIPPRPRKKGKRR